MLRTSLSLMLAGLLMLGLSTSPVRAAQGSDNAKAVEEVRQKVSKIGTGEKARVTVRKKDGVKIKGSITQATADDFTVRDKKSNDATTILYSDVAKLDDNRGSALKNTLLIVGLSVGIFVVGIGILIVSLKD
jgi:hypothetical protein